MDSSSFSNPINLQCAPPASHLLDILIKIKALSKTGQERIWSSTRLQIWALNPSLKQMLGNTGSVIICRYMQVHTGVCVIILVLGKSYLPHGIFGPAATSMLCSFFLINTSRGKTSFLTGGQSSSCDPKLRVQLQNIVCSRGLCLHNMLLKGWFTQKWKFCHHLIKLFQTCMSFLCLTHTQKDLSKEESWWPNS